MKNMCHRVQVPTRPAWNYAALALIAVVTVVLWATNADGDGSRVAAMLGAAIAVSAGVAGGSRPRKALSHGRRSTKR